MRREDVWVSGYIYAHTLGLGVNRGELSAPCPGQSPPPRRRKSLRYRLNRRLDVSQSGSGRCGRRKILLFGLELRIFGSAARSKLAITTALSWLATFSKLVRCQYKSYLLWLKIFENLVLSYILCEYFVRCEVRLMKRKRDNF